MIEIEKIAYAKSFIDKLANGINPIDDNPIAECDVVNNVRLSRCFFFVSDILRQVIENGGINNKTKKEKKLPFSITQAQLSLFPYSNNGLTISEISETLNSLVDTTQLKVITYKDISSFLLKVGMLQEQIEQSGKIKKAPTEQGLSMGIFTEKRLGRNGEYIVILYNKQAQKFIIDNIDVIIESKNNQK